MLFLQKTEEASFITNPVYREIHQIFATSSTMKYVGTARSLRRNNFLQ